MQRHARRSRCGGYQKMNCTTPSSSIYTNDEEEKSFISTTTTIEKINKKICDTKHIF